MGGMDFIQEAEANLAPLGIKPVPLLTPQAIREHFAEDIRSDVASFEGKKGYVSRFHVLLVPLVARLR